MSLLFALNSRRRLAVLAVLALAAVGVGLLVTVGADPSTSARCERQEAVSRARAAADTGSGERVVVIGDSWTVGSGREDVADLWPARLPGRVHVEGWGGSGFSAGASPCEGAQYADRAAAAVGDDAGLVVVQGGLNDFDQPAREIREGARQLLETLAGNRVVLVGPPRAPVMAAPDGSRVDRVDAALARVAARHDVPYVSTLDWHLDYLPDGLHPTEEGHRAFGERVAAALEQVGE